MQSLQKSPIKVNQAYIAKKLNLSTGTVSKAHFDQIAQLVKKGVNAWICASELAAYELCTGLKARGLGIPDDVAITGFDSNVGNSNGQWHITSMKVPSQEMGSAALRIIQSRKENSEIPRQVLLFDCEFVEGNTA